MMTATVATAIMPIIVSVEMSPSAGFGVYGLKEKGGSVIMGLTCEVGVADGGE
jgi:hypothetical protein